MTDMLDRLISAFVTACEISLVVLLVFAAMAIIYGPWITGALYLMGVLK
jgi:hypothetical protein